MGMQLWVQAQTVQDAPARHQEHRGESYLKYNLNYLFSGYEIPKFFVKYYILTVKCMSCLWH